MSSPIQFDWSQGRAFLQDGTIFYSPNSSRTVIVPARESNSSPFNEERLDASLFKQPVWWSDVYGWQSFIPLAPSYTSTPFEPFCWMPRIVDVEVLVDPKSTSDLRERRFEMHPDDCFTWTKREKLLTEAAERIRIWFKIPGNLPPAPSMFHYDRPHKSRGIAKKMISLARDWFAVWMGFVSYLIASTGRFSPSSSPLYSQPDPDSPFPVWYSRLLEKHNYSAAWLDGLTSSTVCLYDAKTFRAGVVFRWSRSDITRPPIKWFLSHHIPMWFVWSKAEEQAISENRSYNYLLPPSHLIQDALTLLFTTPVPGIPLAGLILQRYYDMGNDPVTNETVKFLRISEAPSFVLQYTTKIFLNQHADLARVDSTADASLSVVLKEKWAEQCANAHAEAALPTQTMLEGVEEKGKLFNHWEEFMSKRAMRQAEIIAVETSKERQKRLSREQNPGVKNANLYTWGKVRSSGGKEVYMRLRVSKKWNESVYASYRSHQRIYNSLTNEWDLCKEFDTRSNECRISNTHCSQSDDSDNSDSDSDSDSDSGWQCNQDDGSGVQQQQPAEVPEPVACRSLAPPWPIDYQPSAPLCPNSVENRPLTTSAAVRSHQVPSSQAENMDVVEDTQDLSPFVHYSQDVVQTLSYGYGYVPSMSGSATIQVPEKDWEGMLLTLGFVSPFSKFDVDAHERQAMSEFFTNILKKTAIPSSFDDLNDLNHAALRHLVDFKAIRRPMSDLFVFWAPRSAASDWLLGVHSAEVALYVCRYILSNPRAHTVVTVATRLLERGIPFRTLLGLESSVRYMTVGHPYTPPSFRLADHIFTPQDFEAYMLRCQTVLSQPQGRAALLHGGIVWRIAKEFLSMDGALSGPSVEVISHRAGYMCPSKNAGVYYCDDELTENEIALICGTYSLYTRMGQITVKSWFPPPICWNKDRAGVQWIEWTARNEQFFVERLRDIRAGKARPLTVVEWTTRLRGLKTARTLRDNNRIRANAFMEQLVPV